MNQMTPPSSPGPEGLRAAPTHPRRLLAVAAAVIAFALMAGISHLPVTLFGALPDGAAWRFGYLAAGLGLLGIAVAYIDRLILQGQATQSALEEALSRASSLEAALHHHAMVTRTDTEDRIIGANDNFCARSGYTLQELVGSTHRLLSSGEHPREFFADLHRTIRSGRVWTGDICNKTKQGDFFWSRTTIVPFRNAGGHVYQYVALRTDISELKFMQRQVEVANESLAASFDLLYATVNSSASGIVTTDRDGIIVMMNETAELMLGYGQQEAEGRLSMLQLHDPAQVTAAIMAAEGRAPLDLDEVSYRALAAAVAASPARDWVYRTGSGRELPVSISIAPLKDRQGELQGYVTSFNDLTRLRQVEVMKSDFVSMVSHELRTPLTSIKGALTLLHKMAGPAMPDNQRKLLDIGVGNCESLVNLVSDILDFEKISRNEMSFEMQPHDARALVEKAVAGTQPYATQFGVTYWVDKEDHPLPVRVDARRFEQVMMNLLSNAAKFSHAGSEVLISAHAEDGMVTISVTDTGVGIPEAFQPKIFQRFSQVNHADRPTKIKGTGLGLSIAKMIVEAHGGVIGFRSTEGVGTTFFVRLPLTIFLEGVTHVRTS
jgi:PAS domain S-box-containing protein